MGCGPPSEAEKKKEKEKEKEKNSTTKKKEGYIITAVVIEDIEKYQRYLMTVEKEKFLHIFDISSEKYYKFSYNSKVDEGSSYIKFSNCVMIAGGKKGGKACSDCMILALKDNETLLEFQVKNMNIAKFQTSLVFAQEKSIFSLGGFTDSDKSLNACEEYSIKNKNWSNIKSLQEAKGDFAACYFKDFIYAFGGKTDSTPKYSFKIERYDLVTQSEWTFVQCSAINDSSLFIDCGVCPYDEENILIFGTLGKVNWIYSTESNDLITLDIEEPPSNSGFKGKPMHKFENKHFAVDANLNVFLYESTSKAIVMIEKEIWANSSVPAIPSISAS